MLVNDEGWEVHIHEDFDCWVAEGKNPADGHWYELGWAATPEQLIDLLELRNDDDDHLV